jgi:type IV pilus assembly protein PilV
MSRATLSQSHRPPGLRQRGSFMLEALIAVLIVAFGLLGLIGMEARALQSTGDAQYRSEAAYLATDNLGKMWTYDLNLLIADFSDTAGPGTPYDEFKKMVALRLPGAASIAAPNPAVTITNRGGAGGPASNGFDVDITVSWQPPGDTVHNFRTTATVRLN